MSVAQRGDDLMADHSIARRYVAEPTGLAALKAKLLLLLRIVGEDQTPSGRFKPEGYRLETLVR